MTYIDLSKKENLIQLSVSLNDDGTYSLAVANATLSDATNITGQVTVTTSGVPVSGPDVSAVNGFFLKAHPDNTDTVWVFESGESKTSGFPLDTGESVYSPVSNLNLLDFDADASGEKICYSKA